MMPGTRNGRSCTDQYGPSAVHSLVSPIIADEILAAVRPSAWDWKGSTGNVIGWTAVWMQNKTSFLDYFSGEG